MDLPWSKPQQIDNFPQEPQLFFELVFRGRAFAHFNNWLNPFNLSRLARLLFFWQS